MGIRDWPTGEGPREKLLQQGAKGLSDAELLAVLLRNGLAGQSAVELARDLLAAFGSLRQLLVAPLNQVARIPGMGPVKYTNCRPLPNFRGEFPGKSCKEGRF